MRNISMFVEDQAHYEFLKALLSRLAEKYDVLIDMEWKNVRRGHGKVISEPCETWTATGEICPTL